MQAKLVLNRSIHISFTVFFDRSCLNQIKFKIFNSGTKYQSIASNSRELANVLNAQAMGC